MNIESLQIKRLGIPEQPGQGGAIVVVSFEDVIAAKLAAAEDLLDEVTAEVDGAKEVANGAQEKYKAAKEAPSTKDVKAETKKPQEERRRHSATKTLKNGNRGGRPTEGQPSGRR